MADTLTTMDGMSLAERKSYGYDDYSTTAGSRSSRADESTEKTNNVLTSGSKQTTILATGSSGSLARKAIESRTGTKQTQQRVVGGNTTNKTSNKNAKPSPDDGLYHYSSTMKLPPSSGNTVSGQYTVDGTLTTAAMSTSTIHNVSQQRHTNHQQLPESKQSSPERFETISQFGLVEVTTPQPVVVGESIGNQPSLPTSREYNDKLRNKPQQHGTKSGLNDKTTPKPTIPPTDISQRNSSTIHNDHRHQQQHQQYDRNQTISSHAMSGEATSNYGHEQSRIPNQPQVRQQSQSRSRISEEHPDIRSEHSFSSHISDRQIPTTRSFVDAGETVPNSKPTRNESSRISESSILTVGISSNDVLSTRQDDSVDDTQMVDSDSAYGSKSAAYGKNPKTIRPVGLSSRIPPLRQIRRPPPPSTVEQKSASTTKSTDSIVSTSAVGGDMTPRSVSASISIRASKIPSPKSVNPNAINLLPRRNTSPRRGTSSSPEKRLSPRRFVLASSSAAASVETNGSAMAQSQKAPQTNLQFPQPNEPLTSIHRLGPGSSRKAPLRMSNDTSHNDNERNGYGNKDLVGTKSHLSSNSFAGLDGRRVAIPIRSMTPMVDRLQEDRSKFHSQQQHGKDDVNLSPGRNLTNVNTPSRQNDSGKSKASVRFPVQIGRIETKSQSPERETTAAQPKQPIDSASLRAGQLLSIKSYCIHSTIQAQSNTVLASVDGYGLGEEHEVLKVLKLEPQSQTIVSGVLNFGDCVIFQSSTGTNNALGVRRRKKDVTAKEELGFFDIGNNLCDQWKIVAFNSNQTLPVGRKALQLETSVMNDSDYVSGPVAPGDPILLRNCFNGGYLSIQNGKLSVITDSYGRSNGLASVDPSLLGQLQSHDQIVPTDSEIFQLVLPSAPPCPEWVVSDGLEERVFWSGSYVLKSSRNDMLPDVDSLLFPQQADQYYFSGNKDSNIPRYSWVDDPAKERILLDEVIGSFLGLESVHIKLNDEMKFQLCNLNHFTISMGLQRTVEQLVVLSDSYVYVNDFVESHSPGYEYGRVMHAFCETLGTYLEQFLGIVTQLEIKVRKSNDLTIHSLQFEASPFLHSMAILQNIVAAVRDKKGGGLINGIRSLEKRVYFGDSVAHDIFVSIIEKTSEPYVQMLLSWLESGHLRDPYDEFMIISPSTTNPQETEMIDGDSWMSMFEVRPEDVITDVFQDDATVNKILLAGKYWNAVQSCGVDVDGLLPKTDAAIDKQVTVFQFNQDTSTTIRHIESMYHHASENLVFVLNEKYRLKEAFRVMKRYFLLDQGDFLVNFLDQSEDDLRQAMDDVQIGRIQHFLSLSIQQTETQRDGDQEFLHPSQDTLLLPTNLRCRFSTTSLIDELDSMYGSIADKVVQATPSRRPYGTNRGKEGTGIDMFMIDFAHIPFPLSIVLSEHVMSNYKLLFRHLFFVKHVERRLVAVWWDHQRFLKKLGSLRAMLGPTFLLRQRMVHFVQNLMNYMTFEVVESNWMQMMESIDRRVPDPTAASGVKLQTVDDILAIHDGFLRTTLENCLLTNPFLIGSLNKVLNTCLLFTEQMRKFMASTKIDKESTNLASVKQGNVQRSLNDRGGATTKASGVGGVGGGGKKLNRSLSALREEREAMHQRHTRRVGREITSDSYRRMITRFDEVFTADLSMFMVQLNTYTSSSTVANLGIRLDYNGFIGKGTMKSKWRR